MKEGRPSFSAEVVAAMRALESKRPEHLRICHDPYAKYLIRPIFRLLAQSSIIRHFGLKYIEWRGPGFQAGIAARTRYIDELVQREVADGAKQLVILGAGLDARALRLETLKDIRVFEVDFPATQSYKLSRLRKNDLSPRDHITYAPIDFNREGLQQVLIRAGYDPTVRTIFIWEGVTMYLDATAIDSTLAFIARNAAKGTSVFFDYFLCSALRGDCDNPESVALRRHNSFIGSGKEQYTFCIEDGTIGRFLEERGFHLLEHMTGDTLKSCYFSGRNAARHVFRICGFVHAGVKDTTAPA